MNVESVRNYCISEHWILLYAVPGNELGFAQAPPDLWMLDLQRGFFALRDMDDGPGLSYRDRTSLCRLSENGSLVQLFAPCGCVIKTDFISELSSVFLDK